MAVTRAEVEQLFTSRNVPIATPTETAEQRLERITNQINSGARTMDEVASILDAQAARIAAGEEVYFDPEGAVRYGGEGARELQARQGASPEVWRESDTGMAYLVYYVPNTDVPLLYTADSSQLSALFGDMDVTFDRTLTSNEIMQLGGLRAGSADDPQANPYEELLGQIEREAAVRPWLRDAEVLALITEAAIEGRSVTTAEFQQTQWWQNQTEQQRAWAVQVEADPATAAQLLESTQIQTRSALQASGVANAPAELIRQLAIKLASGEWSQTKYLNQIKAISDPYSGIALDGSLAQFVRRDTGLLDTTSAEEDRVRELAASWLGPAFGNMTDDAVRQWAGQLRNNPDAEAELIEAFKSQRMAMFPEYTNQNLTYEQIASPWRNLVFQRWGQMPDETSSFFTQLVRMNDVAEAERQLRSEGVRRGVTKVKDDLIAALGATSVGQRVRSL